MLLSIFVAEDEDVSLFALETTLAPFLCFQGSVFGFESDFSFKLLRELLVVSHIGCFPTLIVLAVFNAVQHLHVAQILIWLYKTFGIVGF